MAATITVCFTGEFNFYRPDIIVLMAHAAHRWSNCSRGLRPCYCFYPDNQWLLNCHEY